MQMTALLDPARAGVSTVLGRYCVAEVRPGTSGSAPEQVLLEDASGSAWVTLKLWDVRSTKWLQRDVVHARITRTCANGQIQLDAVEFWLCRPDEMGNGADLLPMYRTPWRLHPAINRLASFYQYLDESDHIRFFNSVVTDRQIGQALLSALGTARTTQGVGGVFVHTVEVMSRAIAKARLVSASQPVLLQQCLLAALPHALAAICPDVTRACSTDRGLAKYAAVRSLIRIHHDSLLMFDKPTGKVVEETLKRMTIPGRFRRWEHCPAADIVIAAMQEVSDEQLLRRAGVTLRTNGAQELRLIRTEKGAHHA